MTEEIISIDTKDLVDIYGVNDDNIQLLRKIFPQVKLVARGNELRIVGDRLNIDEFVAFFMRLQHHYQKYNKLSENDILQLLENGKSKNCLCDASAEDDIILYGREGRVIRARSPNQLRLVKSIQQNDMVFAIGPAGTGKTYTAVALAVKALKNKEIRRIILTRPAVEAGENLGFLPGDLRDKLDPYLQPLYDALRDMIPPQRLLAYMEDKVIEIAPLAFMRGRTLDHAYVILDEAQNTTSMQLKMFLTRMGNNANFFITGDLTQIDLPRYQSSGLLHAVDLLKDIKGIDVIYMTQSDIVRHKLVTSIVNAYEKDAEMKNNKA
jgi:phosphate starvation-inducible PhoH-like protein